VAKVTKAAILCGFDERMLILVISPQSLKNSAISSWLALDGN